MHEIIDLRSDTVTKPTEEMRRAMYNAEVGDDVFGEDPTVNELERRCAEITGKQAALFVPSGTMANSIAVYVLTNEGDEVIVEEKSHIYNMEVAHLSLISRVLPRPLPSKRGEVDIELIKKNIRKRKLHIPGTSLICIENTHNFWGGKVISPEYVKEVYSLAKNEGINLHIDGARIFNASVAYKRPITDWTEYCDTVMFCFSKGLSCPVGSVLCGDKKIIDEARRTRKFLGGGMRQAGVLAACGLVALEKMINRLEEDHQKAKRLAYGIYGLPGIKIDPGEVETNIIIFEFFHPKLSIEEFLYKLKENKILALPISINQIRMVTHKDVDFDDIERTIEVFKKILCY